MLCLDSIDVGLCLPLDAGTVWEVMSQKYWLIFNDVVAQWDGISKEISLIVSLWVRFYLRLLATVSQGGRDDGEHEQENYHKRTLQIYQVKFDRSPEPQSEHILSHSEHDLTENVPKNCQKNVVIGLNHKT